MKTQLQLLLSTLALTVLIWAYADQAVHDTYQTTVLVRYVAPPEPGNPYVLRIRGAHADTPNLIRAEIAVRGPKSAIRQLEKDDAAGRFTISIVLPEELKSGPQPPRDLFEDLGRLPEIRTRGLTLQRVSPRTVQLEVDRFRNLPVNVEVNAGAFEKSLVGKPVVRPERVTARVLDRLQDALATPLKVPIEEELQARSDQPGGTFSFDVPLRSSWPGVEAAFSPDHVRVTVSIARRTVRERITMVPVGVLVEPQDFFNQYEIEWQDETGGHFTQAIDVRVPMEKAGQLKGSMIDAYVLIKDSDLPKELPTLATMPTTQESWIEREIHFVLPAGYEDVKIEGPPRTVKFRIKRRPDAKVTPVLPLPALTPEPPATPHL